ncbi:MAG: type II secretion system protein GspG [Nitrospina sp.]|nr:type II secretion system protein GspG [Nitrospina sp.]
MNITTRARSVLRVGHSGFTFVEVMVSLVFLLVLGVLTARFVMAVETRKQVDLRKAREGVMLLKSALGAYAYDLQKPPPTSEEGGLGVLVKEGYLEAVPKDPWGNVYQYDYPGEISGRSYDLYSLGPDGTISEDDIADWNLYGKVYRGTSRIARKRDRALSQYDPEQPEQKEGT